MCDDFNSKVEELLNIDGSLTKTSPKHLDIGNRNVQIHNGFSQVSFLDLFHNYNENNLDSLRSQPDLQIPRNNTSLKGIESVRYFRAVIWNNIPIEIRSIEILKHLKQKSENGSQHIVHEDYVKLM